jgi:hypothetical protein
VRFFGGAAFDSSLCSDPDLARKGYAGGVPMGGDLALPAGGAPSFIVSAMADETPLERLQIVKGWVDGTGALNENVYDVAVQGGGTVDTNTISDICRPN